MGQKDQIIPHWQFWQISGVLGFFHREIMNIKSKSYQILRVSRKSEKKQILKVTALYLIWKLRNLPRYSKPGPR
jgi:hypothetical protein